MSTIHTTAMSSENWDDDFEFHTKKPAHLNSPPRKHHDKTTHDPRMSFASEDWDVHDTTRPPLEDHKNTYSQHAELPQTTTPTKHPIHTENWDDDFEDSPVRNKENVLAVGKSRLGQVQTRPRRVESWDDDFQLGAPSKTPRKTARLDDDFDSEDEWPPTRYGEDDDDLDVGFADRDDEDRTVTARSRRAALSRLTAGDTPPPPVPTLPLPFILNPTHPFPHSPTASIFTAPASSTSSHHNPATSTTQLRPRSSFTRGITEGFKNLPPSPPIHKERERRRLRKKSRVPPALIQGVFELTDMGEDDHEEGNEDIGLRSTSPSTPPPYPDSAEHTTPASTSFSLTSPGSKGSALLSRIGSVKKWGVRRKDRSSTTPSEVARDASQGQMPRPHSSLSSLGSPRAMSPPPSVPPSSARKVKTIQTGTGNWFSRNSSLGSPPEQGGEMEAVAGFADSPTKLLKRKSLGFIQLRRVPGGGGGEEAGTQPQAASSTRYVSDSYSGLGHGRPADGQGKGSVDDLKEREREWKEKEKAKREEDERQVLKDKEGNRGMRRLSLAGRHKRTKSGVSVMESSPSVSSTSSSQPPQPLPEPRSPPRRNRRDEVEDSDKTPSKPRFNGLLPPIELQPPSPPNTVKHTTPSPPLHLPKGDLQTLLSPSTSAPSVVPSPPSTPMPSRRKSGTTSPKSPASPQSASLGRTTVAPGNVDENTGGPPLPRRNSLGDLKIPARISQAQVGLKRDLGMVREFAANVEQLKELQMTYHYLVMEVQGVLDTHHVQAQSNPPTSSRAASPSFFRGMSRNRSNTNPNTNPPPQPAYKQLASAFYTINSKYRISWECAELLIELGGGSTAAASSPPSTSASAPAMHGGAPFSAAPILEGKKGRERAITLAGDESKPPIPVPGSIAIPGNGIPGPSSPLASPPSLAWRASTGRHDLSHRQLVLLREMLNTADSSSFAIESSSGPIPEESATSLVPSVVNREWRWGSAMSSTITLPSEDSGAEELAKKKRRSSRLGMSGLRDMLKSLTRSHSDNTSMPSPPPPLPTHLVPVSTSSLSTDSSFDSQSQHRYNHPHIPVPAQGRRRAKTSTGPESVRSTGGRDTRPTSPYSPASFSGKQSPRRPSLASIFRIGQRNRVVTPPSATAAASSDGGGLGRFQGGGSSTGEEEDWDRIESSPDVEAAATAFGVGRDGSATIRGTRGRSPFTQDAFLPPGYPSTRPVTPKRSVSGSRPWGDSPSDVPRTTRLSNVEEHTGDGRAPRSSSKGSRSKTGASPARPASRARKPVLKTGSVRSMPPQSVSSSLPDPKLAMTPENIRPLLENAREVHARLNECIAEIRSLLSAQYQV